MPTTDNSYGKKIREYKNVTQAIFKLQNPTRILPGQDSSVYLDTHKGVLRLSKECCNPAQRAKCDLPGPFDLSLIDPLYNTGYNMSFDIIWKKTQNASSESIRIDPSYGMQLLTLSADQNNNIATFSSPYYDSTTSFIFHASSSCGSIHEAIANIQVSQACFLAGAIIYLANGTTKKIEDIQVGDIVLGAFGEHNIVLARQFPILGKGKMCKINGEHDTTDHHPHISTDKKFYTCDTSIIDNDVYGKSHYVMNGSGEIVLMKLHGLNKGRVQTLTTGIELQTISGGKQVETIELYSMEPNTELYNLVVGGSHTYIVNGYAVTGWPREDDFNYDTWTVIQSE